MKLIKMVINKILISIIEITGLNKILNNYQYKLCNIDNHNKLVIIMIEKAKKYIVDESSIKPIKNTVFTSCTYAGGGFKSISYYGSIQYLLHNSLIDKNTQFYGTSLGAFWAIFSCVATNNIIPKNKTDEIIMGMQTFRNSGKQVSVLKVFVVKTMMDLPRTMRTPSCCPVFCGMAAVIAFLHASFRFKKNLFMRFSHSS